MMKYFVLALCLALGQGVRKPVRRIPIPGHIRGLVKQTAEQRAEGHNQAMLKSNHTRAVVLKSNRTNGTQPMMDATDMSPAEAQRIKVEEAQAKAKKEKTAKKRKEAGNLTRSDMDCLKCKTGLCPFLDGFCSGMCGLPCTPR